MTPIPGLLDTLIAALGDLGSPVGAYLRPGLGEAEIRAGLGAFDLRPTAELLDWYGRLDGVDYVAAASDGETSSLEVFVSVSLVSLDEAVERCQERRANLLEVFGAAGLDGPLARATWREAWFPVLFAEECMFVVECDGDGAPSGPVWRVFTHPGPFETGIVADDLATFLDRLVTEIRAGSVWWDEPSRSIQPLETEEWRLPSLGLY